MSESAAPSAVVGWLVLRWCVPSCVLSCLSCVRFVACSRVSCPGLRFVEDHATSSVTGLGLFEYFSTHAERDTPEGQNGPLP